MPENMSGLTQPSDGRGRLEPLQVCRYLNVPLASWEFHLFGTFPGTSSRILPRSHSGVFQSTRLEGNTLRPGARG